MRHFAIMIHASACTGHRYCQMFRRARQGGTIALLAQTTCRGGDDSSSPEYALRHSPELTETPEDTGHTGHCRTFAHRRNSWRAGREWDLS